MGGRYGGDINGRRDNQRPFFPGRKKLGIKGAMETIGRDTRRPFEAIGKGARDLVKKGKEGEGSESGARNESSTA